MHFLIAHPARWLRTHFREPTFRSSGAAKHRKNSVSILFYLSVRLTFFLLTLSSLTLPITVAASVHKPEETYHMISYDIIWSVRTLPPDLYRLATARYPETESCCCNEISDGEGPFRVEQISWFYTSSPARNSTILFFVTPVESKEGLPF